MYPRHQCGQEMLCALAHCHFCLALLHMFPDMICVIKHTKVYYIELHHWPIFMPLKTAWNHQTVQNTVACMLAEASRIDYCMSSCFTRVTVASSLFPSQFKVLVMSYKTLHGPTLGYLRYHFIYNDPALKLSWGSPCLGAVTKPK